MSDEIKNVVTFYEGDSQEIIDNNILNDLDLFLVSDHFMHLQYDKADYIIKKIMSDWNPNYIMLRELKKDFETPNHPRLFCEDPGRTRCFCLFALSGTDATAEAVT